MLSAIAIVPSAPVLVPELAGAAAAEVADLTAATAEAAALLPDRWVAIGTGQEEVVVGTEEVGKLEGLGVEV